MRCSCVGKMDVYFRPKGHPDRPCPKRTNKPCEKHGEQAHVSRGSHILFPRRVSLDIENKLSDVQVPRGRLPMWRPITVRHHQGERHALLPSGKISRDIGHACCETAWVVQPVMSSSDVDRVLCAFCVLVRMYQVGGRDPVTQCCLGLFLHTQYVPEGERLLQFLAPY